MAAAADAAAMQNALNAHDRIRKSTDIPKFHGNPAKDVLGAKTMLARIETAARVARWDDARKCDELELTLRDEARLWHESMSRAGKNVNDWTELQREFLKAYEPRYSPKTYCTNFAELVQRPGEKVQSYWVRVDHAFDKMCTVKPANIDVVTLPHDGVAADLALNLKKEGISQTQRHFLHQIFMAGLRPDLRAKVMDANKDIVWDSVEYAREQEIILADTKGQKVNLIGQGVAAVTAAAAVEDVDEDEEIDLDEDELAILNAIRFKKGKAPFRSRFNKGQGPRRDKKDMTCRYCKKKGHLQADCFSRQKAGAPCVDAKGEPYKKRINAVAEEVDIKQVQAVTQLDPLNWYATL